MALALALAMLTNGHAQSTADPALIEAIRGFEAALREKDLDRALLAWQFASPADRTAEETALRGIFSSQQVTL